MQYRFVESLQYDDALEEAITGSSSITVLKNSAITSDYDEFAIIIENSYIIAKFKEFFKAAL